MKYKAAILGAGPAGIACAVQLKRYGIDTLIFEKNQIGGLLRNANFVENYLGFDNGISGKELVEKFRKNLEINNIEPVFEEVKKVSYSECFLVETDKNLYQSEILVIASGTVPKQLTISCHCDEAIQQSNKIFYEIADLPEKDYSGKRFAIIGSGDAAFDYALNLVNNYHADEIVIINRNSKAKCLPLLEKRAELSGKIKHMSNTLPEAGLLNNFDYVLVAIGRTPNFSFLDENLVNDIDNLAHTNLLYKIGDVKNSEYRQISIACADGIKTAMKIYLNTIS